MAHVKNVRIEEVRDQIRSENDESRRLLLGMRRELEQIIEKQVAIFEQLNRFDEDFRLRIYKGEFEYCDEDERAIRELFVQWSTFCEQFVPDVQRLIADGISVRGAEKFLRCFNEAKGILTDDAEFFSRDKLAKMRDQAIDDYRAGKCEPVWHQCSQQLPNS